MLAVDGQFRPAMQNQHLHLIFRLQISGMGCIGQASKSPFFVVLSPDYSREPGRIAAYAEPLAMMPLSRAVIISIRSIMLLYARLYCRYLRARYRYRQDVASI